MELEKEFKLGTQQVIGLYNELTDFLDMNTDQDIEDQIQYMKATAIGPFHDNLVSMGLVQVTINEILENGK